jgi:hypothetical protein
MHDAWSQISNNLFLQILVFVALAAVVGGFLFAMIDCFVHRNDRNDWERIRRRD